MLGRVSILTVINSLDAGGAEGHLLRVLPKLDRKRFDASVLPLQGGGVLTPQFEACGIQVLDHAGGVRHAMGLFRRFQRQHRALVHFYLPKSYLLGAPLALLTGSRGLIMSRRSRNHYQTNHPVAAKIERWLHQRMDRVLGNSRAVIDDLVGEGVEPTRLRLIYNGIDVERFHAGSAQMACRSKFRAELSVANHSIVIVCVANLYRYKGHTDLLKAFALLTSSFPENDLTLLLVGRDAGEMDALKGEAISSGIAERVRFLGERSDVPELLAASDIGVLASHEEGFSNAILEGMAAGLPMVVTDVGGNAEAVHDQEIGFVVPPKLPEVLADRLSRLVASAQLRARMGGDARVRVAEKFSLQACVGAHESLYSEIWFRHNADPVSGCAKSREVV